MGSVYNNLQSHPYQKDQSHYRPVSMPLQMYMNPPQPSPGHGYWPWANNYGHASPVACHGFCNHSYYPPHYAWGSPYSHAPPYQCPGSYHPYPIQYMPPPGCLSEPWYECEKSVPGVHHCCGCPHHPQHPKEQRSLRIEEEEPAGEREVIKGPMDDSKSPFCFTKQQPYPIVWFPPGYSSSENGGKEGPPNERPIENKRSGDAGVPNLWNGWYPLDLNRLALSKQVEDQEKNNHHHQQDNEAKGRLPFPLVWMPYEPPQQEKEEQSDSSSLQGQKSNDLPTSWVKDAPVMKVEQHEDKEKSRIRDQGIDVSGNGSFSSKVKEIPVKELGQDPVMKASGDGSISSKVKDIPVKELGQHEEQKASDKDISDNNEKKKQLDNGSKKSTSKSSKLPPVCLRIDPLPKRSSKRSPQQSPSPLGEKQKPNKSSNEESNTPSPSVSKKHNDTMEKEAIGSTKNIEVVEGLSKKEITKKCLFATRVR